MPGAKDLDKDEYPFVAEQTHYKGKKYGTIYYVGPQIAMYNAEHVKQAGFAKPPATFDELRVQATQIKRQKINGTEFPLWGAPSEGLLENLYLASGKRMFDEDLQPTFGRDALFKDIVDKLYQSYTGDKIFGSDPSVAAAFDNGKSSYAWTSFYDLKRLNGQATGAVAGGQAGGAAAGQLMNYVNPGFVAGKTGTQAICRQYAVAASSRYPRESWRLISFLGGKDAAGKYSVAKRWWVEQGLNFGYKSMGDDPDIKKSVEGWGDLDAYNKVMLNASPRPGVKAPWSALWRTEFAKVVADVMEGAMASKDGIDRGVQIWTQMRADFERNNPPKK
jgi:ABC-type glycerol-3-phosphate transport system substrate-binding protein